MVEATSDKEFKQQFEELKDEAGEIKGDTDQIKREVDGLKEDVSEIKDNVRKAAEEQEDFKSKYYYLAAETDNMRKRFEREKSNLIKFGNEKILTNLIDVLDNFERTVVAIEGSEDEKIKNICLGIKMVKTQFLDVLKKNGLEEVESLGKDFDPQYHEAVAQQPSEGKRDQEVITEYQKGYVLNGRLLRAAKVVVAKN